MKTSHIALLSTLFLLGGCTQPADDPEPARKDPQPRKVHVPVRRGILDWGAYDRWLQDPPQLVQVEDIDSNTARLLARKVNLAETILSDPEPRAAPDYTANVARLREKQPAPASSSYRRQDPDSWIWRTVSVQTQQALVDNYFRRWRGITESNLDSVVTQLERQYKRDLERYEGNIASTPRGTAQRSANLSYLRSWPPILEVGRGIISEMEAPPPSSAREQILVEWRDFQTDDLPIIRQVIEQKEISRHQPSSDGSYEIEGRGELLIYFKVGSAELYYPLRAPHRFRLFDDRREFLTRPAEAE